MSAILLPNYEQAEAFTSGDSTIHIRGRVLCDTAADLPSTTFFAGFTLDAGSTALDISTAAHYMLNTAGAWILQRSADISSLVNDISNLQLNLQTVQTDAVYSRYSLDNYIFPAVRKLANDGAKNRLNLAAAQTVTDNGITFTVNSDFSITMTGSTTSTAWLHVPVTVKAGTYKFVGMTEQGGSSGSYRLEFRQTETSGVLFVCDTMAGITATFDEDKTCFFNVRVNNYDFGADNSKTVYPMLCVPALYNVTSEYVPYAPTNRELFEML